MKANPLKKNEKIKTLIFVALIVTVFTASVTMALLNHKTQAADNNFSSKKLVNVGVVEGDKTLEDNGGGNTNTNSYTDITTAPDNTVAKQVAVQNIDREDYHTGNTYVRVRLVPKLVYNDETDYAGQTADVDLTGKITYHFAGVKSSESDSSITLGTWKQQDTNGETYYYYDTAVEPGKKTELLLESVSYDSSSLDDFKDENGNTDKHLEIDVLTEGVSAVQTVDGKDAIEAYWGIPKSALNTMSTVNSSTAN